MEYNCNAFPYEVFPPELMILIEHAEQTLNYPKEYLGSSILSACSVAIGNTSNVKFKENFIVKPNLYMALVGNAGDVKTHPLNFAYEPIERKEQTIYLKYKEEYDEYELLSADEKKRTPKPLYKKYILKDFTPESLIKIHSNNERGIAIVSDELFGWIKNFGRYSSSGEQETYLSLWNGGSISVDRKSDEPIRLDNTFVNIIGTIQTKILPELAKENRGSNGFIERMLFAYNDNPIPVLWSLDELNKDLQSLYNNLIERLFSLECSDYSINYIEFTPEAKRHLINWQNIKRKLLLNDEIGYSIQAKYEIYAIRFSLILQLIHWAMKGKSNEKIEMFAIESALKLVDYYFETALKINQKIYKMNPLEELNELQKQFYKQLEETFTTQQALEMGISLEIPERTIYRTIKNSKIFTKQKHGIYIKNKL